MSIPVLVVDDSSVSRKMLIKCLPQGWDVSISQASNGMEALEAYQAGKGEVIFLDLTMPVMDGYQTLEAIKKSGNKLKAIVFVVSADIQPQAQERVKALGAAAFIKKPVSSEMIVKTLKDHGLL